MADPGLMDVIGAREENPTRFVSLATIKFIGGLQSQRSVLASIDTRYNSKFLGGKPDALFAGQNVEISNSLTLQRRPGLLQFGTPSIPKPQAFMEYRPVFQAVPQESTFTGGATSNITIVVDTASAVYNYSPTFKGIYFNKAVLSSQTNSYSLVNTLYLGDGVDLYKIPGPNLLRYSNTWAFSSSAGTLFAGLVSPWTSANVFSVTTGQTDPNGGTAATAFVWNATGTSAKIEQDVTPNYTPIASNTFTFSVWMKATGGALSVDLQIADQSGSIVDTTFALTTSWQKYQITATMGAGSTIIKCLITNPTSTSPTMLLYGAQLEVGGPATPTQLTLNLPQGVYLWGIQAPTAAPNFSFVPNTKFPAWAPNTTYTIGPVGTGSEVIDSNGNLEVATGFVDSSGTVHTSGTAVSGTTTPNWMTQAGQITNDGAVEAIVQTFGGTSTGNSLTINVPNPTVASDALFLWIFQSNASDGASHSNPTVSDNKGNTWTALTTAPFAYDTFAVSLFWVNSVAGATGTIITVSSGGSNGTYAVGFEIGNQIGTIDVKGSQIRAVGSTTPFFSTGSINTTVKNDGILSFICLINNQSAGSYVGTAPSLFTSIINNSGLTTKDTSGRTAYIDLAAALMPVSVTSSYNPTWGITNSSATGTLSFGITLALEGHGSYIQWTNEGPAGINPKVGYQYYYAYMSSLTGHVSNVSPISVSTGPQTLQNVALTGQLMPSQTSGNAAHDPQVDLIAIFRNTDGGAFWYLLALIGNGATNQANLLAQGYNLINTDTPSYTATNFTYVDTTPDTGLTTSIFAPLGLLNSPPPAGLINFDYFAGRLWGSVNNLLYFNSAADNFQLINETQNGVPAESWAAGNNIPFDEPITRIKATGGGLLVFTTSDIWVVTGTNLLTGGFGSTRILEGHGLLSYNAFAADGSTLWLYTSDRQMLSLTPGSGSIEVGFPIGDLFEANFDPRTVYITRHIHGSQDNALYFADGSSGWFRLNPNQVGASMSGEQTPVWSPKADFTATIGGVGAIGSVQVTPGVHKLLVGQTVTGPILNRDITTFTDTGTPYEWFATIGSIVLVTAGELAEVESITTEMNNSTGGNATQCKVGVLLEEIAGAFEFLPNSVNDPPQLNTSKTILSNRFYLIQGTIAPVCRHLQIQLEGSYSSMYASTKDEILAITIRGARVPEQG